LIVKIWLAGFFSENGRIVHPKARSKDFDDLHNSLKWFLGMTRLSHDRGGGSFVDSLIA
jgi:hypothetical protein